MCNYLCDTLGAPPVPLGNLLQRRDEAESVIAVVAAVTQQEPVLFVAPPTNQAKIKVDLWGQTHPGVKNQKKSHHREDKHQNTN